ncbi:MAG TPA: GNAT family N-acetyltransferase [Candidatus Dormibacteraeota bacterium]|nr:GNAT family N-acetyltransferase [Candidatus Dormibacteraeota bacterium]
MSATSPGQTFTVRTATRADMPAIVGIYNWAINQTFATIDAEPLSADEAAEWWDEHTRRGTYTLVAVEEGDVIGWARLMPWKQQGYQVVEDHVYVDPLYQRRGVGRELLTRLIEAAHGSGYRTIVASVAADNLAGLRLHERLGFEVVGTLRNAAHKFNRWMDITLVQRSLGD